MKTKNNLVKTVKPKSISQADSTIAQVPTVNFLIDKGWENHQQGNYKEAVEYFKKAGDRKSPSGWYALALMYERGQSVEKNQQEANRLYGLVIAAAEQGNMLAQVNLGIMYKEGHGVAKDNQKAFSWYQLAAKKGSSVAQFNLGLMCEEGQSVAQDYQEAFNWYHLAAKKGNKFAQYYLGRMHEYGRGVPLDYAKACEYYQRAVDLGHVEAQYNLNDIYRLGLNIVDETDCRSAQSIFQNSEQKRPSFKENERALQVLVEKGWQYHQKSDHKTALEYFQLAANKELPSAWYALARMYGGDSSPIKDLEVSNKFYKLIIEAANKGNALAQYCLALMYREGFGVERNFEAATDYLQRSANFGYVEAQHQVARGEQYKKNFEKAYKLYQLAADQGEATAQCDLALMYYHGYGVLQDGDKAHKLRERSQIQRHRNQQYERKVLAYYRPIIEQTLLKGQHALTTAVKSKNVSQADSTIAIAQVPSINSLINKGWENHRQGNYKEAVEYFKKAGDRKSPSGWYALALMYEQGQGVEKNQQEANRLYGLVIAAAEQGNMIAQVNLGTMYKEGHGVAKDNQKAFSWYQLAAKKGSSVAQSNLGFMYYDGQGVPQDCKKAFEYLQLPADKNEPDAQYYLGRMYEHGGDVEQDYSKACGWYQRAADQGHIEARYNLDDIRRLGLNAFGDNSGANRSLLGDTSTNIRRINFRKDERALKVIVDLGWEYQRKHDYKTAMACFRVVANEGSPAGWYALGQMYEGNFGIPARLIEARKFYALVESAAEQGNMIGQYYLGQMYWHGFGGVPKGKKARACFQHSAEHGYVEAQYFLGTIMYRDSLEEQRYLSSVYIAKPDDGKACHWLQLAADQGHIAAQTSLAKCVGNGGRVSPGIYRSRDQSYRKEQYDKRVIEYYKHDIDQIILEDIDKFEADLKPESKIKSEYKLDPDSNISNASKGNGTNVIVSPSVNLDIGVQKRSYGKGIYPYSKPTLLFKLNSRIIASSYGREDVPASIFKFNPHKDLSSFVVAPEVSLALRDYRRNREIGESLDDPQTPFPAANLDALVVRSACCKKEDKRLYPDKEGRYWWDLYLGDRAAIGDYYWMKDEKRGWPDKKNKDCWWFTVHHAPTKTKIEGFSWQPDERRGFPSTERIYWYCVLYTECDDIRKWIEKKEDNYLRREKKKHLSGKSNILKINTRQFGYYRIEAATKNLEINSEITEIVLAYLLQQCIAAFADYREHRENGDAVDNYDEFPGLGFEILELSSSKGNLWPDEGGLYWWKVILKGGEVVNSDFYWKKSVTHGWLDDNDKNRYWFEICRRSTGMAIDGFSYGVDPTCSGERDTYLCGMKHNESFGFSLQYRECGAVKEWMEKKDRNFSARLEHENQTEDKYRIHNNVMRDTQLMVQALRQQIKVRRVREQTQINFQKSIGKGHSWQIRKKIKLHKVVFQNVKSIMIGDYSKKLRAKILTAYVGKKYLEGIEGYVAPIFEDYYQYLNYGVSLNLLDCAVPDDCPIEKIGLDALFHTFFEENISKSEFDKFSIYVLVYSVVDWISYEHIKTIWAPLIKRFIPDASYILVAGDIELRNDLEVLKKLKKDGLEPVSYEMGLKLASDIGAITFKECSSVTGENLTEVFQQAFVISLMTTKQAREHRDRFYRIAIETMREQTEYEKLIEQKIFSDKYTTRRSLAWKKPNLAEPPRSYFFSQLSLPHHTSWDLDMYVKPSVELEPENATAEAEKGGVVLQRPIIQQHDFKEEIDTFLASASSLTDIKHWSDLLTRIGAHPFMGLSSVGWERLEARYYQTFFNNNALEPSWVRSLYLIKKIFTKNSSMDEAFERWSVRFLESLDAKMQRSIQEKKWDDASEPTKRIWESIALFIRQELGAEMGRFIRREWIQNSAIEWLITIAKQLGQGTAEDFLLCEAVLLNLCQNPQEKSRRMVALSQSADALFKTQVRQWRHNNAVQPNANDRNVQIPNALTLQDTISNITKLLYKNRDILRAKEYESVLARYETILSLQQQSLEKLLEGVRLLWQASIECMDMDLPALYTLVLLGSHPRGDATLYSDSEFLLLVGPKAGLEFEFEQNNEKIASYFKQCFQLFAAHILLLGEERNSPILNGIHYRYGVHLDDLLVPFSKHIMFFGNVFAMARAVELDCDANTHWHECLQTIFSQDGLLTLAAVASYDARFFAGDESLFKYYLQQRYEILSQPKGFLGFSGHAVLALQAKVAVLYPSPSRILPSKISVKQYFLSLVSGVIKILSLYHGLTREEYGSTVMDTRERCKVLVERKIISRELSQCLEVIYDFANRFRALSYSYYDSQADSWILFGPKEAGSSLKHLWQVYSHMWKEAVIMLHEVMYPLNHAFTEWVVEAESSFQAVRPFSISPELLARWQKVVAQQGKNIGYVFNHVVCHAILTGNMTHQGSMLPVLSEEWWQFLLVALLQLSPKERQALWTKLLPELTFSEKEEFMDKWDNVLYEPQRFQEEHRYFTESEHKRLKGEIAAEWNVAIQALAFTDGFNANFYRKQRDWRKAVGLLFANTVDDRSQLAEVVMQQKSVVIECLDPGIATEEVNKRIKNKQKTSGLFAVKEAVQRALEDDEKRAFKEAKSKPDGKRHIILFFNNKVNGETYHFCLKIFPENPGMEYAITQLHYSLGGDELPDVWLWRIYTPFYPEGIAALLMEDVRGLKYTPEDKALMLNLAEVPQKNPGVVFAIDSGSFTRHFFRVTLTRPEDDKANDYSIIPGNRKDPSLRFILHRVDNERSMYVNKLFEHSASAGGHCNPEDVKGVLKLKTIIYCMENMGASLSAADISHFMRLDVKTVFKHWLEQIDKWNSTAREIFKLKGIMGGRHSSASFIGEELFAIARQHYQGNIYNHGVFHAAPNPLHVKEADNFCLTVMPVPMNRFTDFYVLWGELQRFFASKKEEKEMPTGLEVLKTICPDLYEHYHAKMAPQWRIGTKETDRKRLANMTFERFYEATKGSYKRGSESSQPYRTLVTSSFGAPLRAEDYESILQNTPPNSVERAADTVAGLVYTLGRYELEGKWPDETEMIRQMALDRFQLILEAPIIKNKDLFAFFRRNNPVASRLDQIRTEFSNLSVVNKLAFRQQFLCATQKGGWNIQGLKKKVKRYALSLLLMEPVQPLDLPLKKLDTTAFKEILDANNLLVLLRKYNQTLEKAIIVTTFNPYEIPEFKSCLDTYARLKHLEIQIVLTEPKPTSSVLKTLEYNLPQLQVLTLSGFLDVATLSIQGASLRRLTLRSFLNLRALKADFGHIQWVALYHCAQLANSVFEDMIMRKLSLDQKMPVIELENNESFRKGLWMRLIDKQLRNEPDRRTQLAWVSNFSLRQWQAFDLLFTEMGENQTEYELSLTDLNKHAHLKVLYDSNQHREVFAKALLTVIGVLSAVYPKLEKVQIIYKEDAPFKGMLAKACNKELKVRLYYNQALLYEPCFTVVKEEKETITAPRMRI